MGEAQRWIPGGLMAVGCLLTLGVDRQKQMPLAAPLGSLPGVLAGYRGTDVKISEAEQRAAGMSTYLYRVFRSDSTQVFTVYVGYYDHQSQGKTIHSPKNCLPGAGWEALESSQVEVPSSDGAVHVNQYLLQRDTQRALVFYWYQGRGRVAASEYRVKWELLRDAALLGRTEEALVRIVVPIGPSREVAKAHALAEAVAVDLVAAVARVLPS